MLLQRELGPGPDLLALKRRAPDRYPLLLESAARGGRARWDLLLAGDGQGLVLGADGTTRTLAGEAVAGSFLEALDAAWAAQGALAADSPAAQPRQWPFHGGHALYLGYELAGQIEPVLRLPAFDGALPLALALRCPVAVLRDRATGRCVLVGEPSAASLFDAVCADAFALMREPVGASLRPAEPMPVLLCIDEEPPSRFLEGVARVHRHLAAGDVFQVNLSRGWQARFADRPDPAALYAALRAVNPAPFAGLLTFGDAAVVSSSPERLVSVRGRRIDTRPIAGTRPRLPGEDEVLRIEELLGHPKERAEHVMLLDLERNDLGRVCEPGSVEVDERMAVESYAHVHHIVSNVTGRLRAGVSPGQVVAAVFPGGTITGCPKLRCMQIIAALEGCGRGPYTGAMGYLDRSGDLDLSILIRTLWTTDQGIAFRAGAGIVVDSCAERELQETRAKALGLLRALDSSHG